jgi:hypothetical protein
MKVKMEWVATLTAQVQRNFKALALKKISDGTGHGLGHEHEHENKHEH